MRLRSYQRMALQTVVVTFLIVPSVVSAATETNSLSNGHTQFTSIVTKKAGALVVTTPNGATHQLNENMARRHGQKPFKAGDEVTVELDETTISSICISKGPKDNIDR